MEKIPFALSLGLSIDDVLCIHEEITPAPGSFLKPSACPCGCDEIVLALQGCADGNIKARMECPECGMRCSGYSDTGPDARDAWNDMVSRFSQGTGFGLLPTAQG